MSYLKIGRGTASGMTATLLSLLMIVASPICNPAIKASAFAVEPATHVFSFLPQPPQDAETTVQECCWEDYQLSQEEDYGDLSPVPIINPGQHAPVPHA